MKSSANASRRICTSLLTLVLFFLFLSVPSLSDAQSNGTMTVRVGYFKSAGYHELLSDGSRRGYGYDFLRMIAPYADIKYEFVGYEKSWNEMLDMLERGEIDLLTMAVSSPERREKFDFVSMNIGLSATMIVANRDNTWIQPGSYTSMNGCRVGLIRGSQRIQSFDEHAKANGFSYVPVIYDANDDLPNALRAREVDIIATTDMLPISHEFKLVGDFDEVPFYAIVKKGNTELLQRLDRAIFTLSSTDAAWRENLRNLYYGPQATSQEFTLTPEEQAVVDRINRGTPLKILINPDRFPYAYTKDGKAEGIFYDLLVMAAKQIGFKYEMLVLNSTQEYNDATIARVPDIIFDSPNTLYSAESKGYNSTKAYYRGNFSVIRRKNSTSNQTVAVKRGALNMNPVYKELYGTSTLIPYDSVDACVQAVKDGLADCCYMYTYTAADYVARDTQGILEYAPIRGNFSSFRIAVRQGVDPQFYAILNRFAASVTDNTMRTLITINRKQPPITIMTLVSRYPMATVSAVALICILSVSAFFSHQERKKQAALSEELRRALEQAEKASNAKTNFLNNMSHDIRTPMNAIIGFTDLAIEHNSDRELSLEHLKKIKTSSSHLLALINDVLDMSRIESGKVLISEKPLSLPTVTDDLYNIVLSDAKANDLMLDFSCDVKDEYVCGDILRLNQILLNCLGNAIKFTPPGGTVSFSIHQTAPAKAGRASYEFKICDTGIGIDAEFLPHIFDPFERERTSTVSGIQGTGLGMSICKNLVELMDGNISVTSEKDKGTQITIALDMTLAGEDDAARLKAEKEAAAALHPAVIDNDAAPAAHQPDDLTGIRVLIVEDNELNLEITCAILEQTGATLDTAEDGSIALEKVQTSPPGYYDIILMDIQMPVMDGYQATESIRRLPDPQKANVPIVAMTANAFEEDRKHAFAAGMNAHIAKPVDIKIFFSTLKEILKRNNDSM